MNEADKARAENLFKSRTTEESGFEAELRAQRDKTARLRALRLARDEARWMEHRQKTVADIKSGLVESAKRRLKCGQTPIRTDRIEAVLARSTFTSDKSVSHRQSGVLSQLERRAPVSVPAAQRTSYRSGNTPLTRMWASVLVPKPGI
jgi:hypothetical protein